MTLFIIKISNTEGPGPREKISRMDSLIILVMSHSVDFNQRGLNPFLGRESGEPGMRQQGPQGDRGYLLVADFEIFNICDLPFHSAHLLPYDLQFLHRKILSFI